LRAITPPPPPQPSSGPLAAPAATYARRSSSPRWPKCLHPTRRHGLSTPRPESMPWPEHAMYWGGSQDVAPDATRRLWRWRMARCGTPPHRARSPPHHHASPRLTTAPHRYIISALPWPRRRHHHDSIWHVASPRLDLARRSTTPLHHAALLRSTCAIPRVQSHVCNPTAAAVSAAAATTASMARSALAWHERLLA